MDDITRALSNIYNTFNLGDMPDNFRELVAKFALETTQNKAATPETKAAAVGVLSLSGHHKGIVPNPRKLSSALWVRKHQKNSNRHALNDYTISGLASYLRDELTQVEELRLHGKISLMDQINQIYYNFRLGDTPSNYKELIYTFAIKTIEDKNLTPEAKATLVTLLVMNPNLGLPKPDPRDVKSYLWGSKRPETSKFRTLDDDTIGILAAHLRGELTRGDCIIHLVASNDMSCSTYESAEKFIINKKYLSLAKHLNTTIEELIKATK